MTLTGMSNRIRAAVAACLCIAALGGLEGCSLASEPGDDASTAPSPTSPSPIKVVATLNQWGSLAEQIGGSAVQVTSLLSSGSGDAHGFEPDSQDIKALDEAAIVLVNGAGYDDWATRHVPSSATIISASQVVGAMDGDNPHLWFSRDARFAVAKELAEAFTRADRSRQELFEGNLATWKQKEQSLEDRMHKFGKEHAGLTYAATEDVAYYLMSDIGFKDTTPAAYRQSAANGEDPSDTALKSFVALLADDRPDLLVSNPQAPDVANDTLTSAAKAHDVPIVEVTEQMPGDCKDLTDWIERLFTRISDAVEDGDSVSGQAASPSTTGASDPDDNDA
ncbi:metal ABC transporter solute-binding protein, Zn/Mn family [Bifidobacterium cuniculi]|uniref:ABC transporter substrate-binding protein n=1 Tax=Bifidobacterium cuniculi TaxID=1688 RepID=A0A087B473_9BIFI|nr:zinc ABC transporter substrate-binding protein [Bifidobacterium cuniculi]KFI65823.1 ABC transporter substrate-binding protein [Bifidobacterium cuniculi]